MNNPLTQGLAAIRPSGPARLAVVGLAVTALLAGCSSDSPAPLVAAIQQKGATICAPAPDPPADITAWNTDVGFVMNYFFDQGSAPVKIRSVALIDPHGLALRGAVVYEMARSLHPLANAEPWNRIATGAGPEQWLHRQHVPGAVIPPEGSSALSGPHARDLYQIAADIQADSPAGGWTIGLLVTYLSGGQTYTVNAYIGYAIAPPPYNTPKFCRAEQNAIRQAFQAAGRT